MYKLFHNSLPTYFTDKLHCNYNNNNFTNTIQDRKEDIRLKNKLIIKIVYFIMALKCIVQFTVK